MGTLPFGPLNTLQLILKIFDAITVNIYGVTAVSSVALFASVIKWTVHLCLPQRGNSVNNSDNWPTVV